MESVKAVMELLAFSSAAALSAILGGALLATLRVAFSSRRRRQFQRLTRDMPTMWSAIRKVLVEPPDVVDETHPRVVRAG